jgi:hypothetical protein
LQRDPRGNSSRWGFVVLHALGTLWLLTLFAIPLAFAAACALAILAGKIKLKGLLTDQDGAFSPGRLQLLIATVVACGYYLGSVVASPDDKSMPDLPAWFIAMMLGSSGLYLGGKTLSLSGVFSTLSRFLRG